MAAGNRNIPVIKTKFSTTDCRVCAHRAAHTRSKRPRRTLTVRPEAQDAALQSARAREAEASFAAEYGRRAGVEGTISEGVRSMHLRSSRYIGLAKTHLQHVVTAASMNLVRLAACFAGHVPEKTRRPAFVRMMTAPA